MGIRKNVLNTIVELLNGKQLILNTTPNPDYDSTIDPSPGNGTLITAVKKIIDIENTNTFPILSVVPAPHTITTGVYGHSMDSTYRVAIFGYVKRKQHEELFDVGEDLIEFILQTLTKWDNVEVMREKRFSIIEFGPILNEQFDEPGNVGYVSVPAVIQFVEN